MTLVQDNIYVWNVSEISNAVKSTIETSFDFIKVRGEVSRPSFPNSGHVYFSLKDDKSVLNAIIWKNDYSRISLKLEEGLEVICAGKLSAYTAGSRYQIIIFDIKHAGEGALLKQLEVRKKKFLAEGLFSEEYKKQIPKFPNCIGVVTSPTGAVIDDILHRIKDRWPCKVNLYPVQVQGKNTSKEIANCIDNISENNYEIQNNIPDLIIIARGGGSIEDLWPFNEEELVRAVFKCKIPVISAIGHETDTTLLDYVSDLRAPTPTAAAELATPIKSDLQDKVKDNEYKINRSILLLIDRLKETLKYQQTEINKSETFIKIPSQKMDSISQYFPQLAFQALSENKIKLSETVNKIPFPEELVFRSNNLLQKVYENFTSNFSGIINKIFTKYQSLNFSINSAKNFLNFTQYGKQIHKAFESQNNLIQNNINLQSNKLLSLGRLLDSNSIHRILQKGFVMATDMNGKPIQSIKKIIEGEIVKLKFKDGLVETKVKTISSEKNK